MNLLLNPVAALFKGRHFNQEIIILCARWYVTYKLSYRDLVNMMAERGIEVAHTTIVRWGQRYVPAFEKGIMSNLTPCSETAHLRAQYAVADVRNRP
jgi:transposase-like protein